MQTEEMRQAMNTLKAFSERERAYHAYQSRQDDLRQQRGLQRHLDELNAAAAQARAAEAQVRIEKERERREKEAALAEVERLKRLLQDASNTTATAPGPACPSGTWP